MQLKFVDYCGGWVSFSGGVVSERCVVIVISNMLIKIQRVFVRGGYRVRYSGLLVNNAKISFLWVDSLVGELDMNSRREERVFYWQIEEGKGRGQGWVVVLIEGWGLLRGDIRVKT